ncbi:DUF2790 domain-containing protein [Azotobacter vinelandii]|uniref:DUF2790 domain-containing protein n=1 Tax=Azotobacter vinelandii TaxID=354 RepID=UPI0026659E9E|nr:DUF2790 domain-containing protein [Azotobacter vinelandii]WKN23610.1 DUF2790 domain-containing protein [Azotobacter vinelandii]
MKRIKLILAIAALSAASLAMAESDNKTAGNPEAATDKTLTLESSTVYAQTPEVEPYKYGMNLDIADFIKIEYLRPEPTYCGPIPAQISYKDSKGELHVVEYLYPDTSGCTDNG